MRTFALMAVLITFPLGLFADRLTLRDGTVLYGRFISGNPHEIVFQSDNGVRRRFDVDRIRDLDFSEHGGDPQAQRYYGNGTGTLFPDDWAVIPAARRSPYGPKSPSSSGTFPEGVNTRPAS